MLRRLSPALLAAILLAAGCGSSSDGTASPSTTSPAGSTTTAAPVDLTPYVKDGPYAAGTVNLALADGRRVAVWYPADKASVAGGPKENFDIASLLTPELQALIPADKRPPYEVDAYPGAAPAKAGGPYPIVLFSHGYAGFPEQSSTLTTHLASWGFVVVAPDHVERSLDGLLGTAAKGVTKLKDPEVLAQSLDLAIAQGKTAGSKLEGLVDSDHVAVIGHSAGAGAAYRLAAQDSRIDSFISYSVGFGGPGDDAAPAAAPKVPGMVMLGTKDGIIPASASRKVFSGMATPKYQVVIDGAGHLVFSDLCLIARDQGGIIGIATEIKLPIPEQLKKLGTDGCQAGALDPRKAFPAIDDLSVDFLRSTLGLATKPVGLDDPTIGEAFTTAPITVTADA